MNGPNAQTVEKQHGDAVKSKPNLDTDMEVLCRSRGAVPAERVKEARVIVHTRNVRGMVNLIAVQDMTAHAPMIDY